MPDLKLMSCPLCGRADTVEFTNAGECGACAKASLSETCCDFEPEGCSMVAVVCNVNRGGCGASSGYANSYKEAAKKWNRRVQLDNAMTCVHDLICSKFCDNCDKCPIEDLDESGECRCDEKLLELTVEE